MFAKSLTLAFAATSLLLMATPVLAQTKTSYQAGMDVARKRGVSNPSCYAGVFARHAIVVENTSGNRNWSAPSTPAYNADMRRKCGVDRLALVRSQDVPRGYSRSQVSSSGHSNAGAYQAGLNGAKRYGYSNPECYARVFARYASPTTSQGRSGTWYSYNPTPAFQSELRQQCNI
ncbi:MAG: hypothetical protein ACRCWF_08690 [Beijerinckiaceae bacterium]